MSAANELTTLIDKLVTEKTFSVDGVKAIEQLRTKAEAQGNHIDKLETNIKELSLEKATAEKERDALKAKDAAWIKREAELVAREAKMVDNEKKAAVAEATAAAMTLALTTVFRPNTVRERVQRSVPVTQGSPPYVSSYGTTEDVVREEGT